MCYVSGCNLHGGYNKMLLMVYLGRTLKLMQNGFEDNWNWLQYREDAFCVHVNVFRQLGEEGRIFLELKFICNEVFWTANEFGDDFGMDDFLDKLNVVFKTHVHAFSTTTLTGIVFCMMRFIFGSCQLFLSTVWMFLEFVQTVRLKRRWKWR